MLTLRNAAGKNIYERYTNGHHPSRGVLVAPCPDITQTHIDKLIAEIHRFVDKDGKCDSEKVCEANRAIIELTSGTDMPCCLKQVEGKYGC